MGEINQQIKISLQKHYLMVCWFLQKLGVLVLLMYTNTHLVWKFDILR